MKLELKMPVGGQVTVTVMDNIPLINPIFISTDYMC